MEPRSRERGNPDATRRCQPPNELQWSRAQESAEIGMFRSVPGMRNALQWSRAQESAEISACGSAASRIVQLQWSRAQESAEIQRRPPQRLRDGAASMEPRSRERGNPGLIGFPLAMASALQWSRAQESAEMTCRWRCARRSSWLQWSRAQESAEIILTPVGRVQIKLGFNGAALKRARKYGCNAAISAEELASMEPRSRERGNSRSPRTTRS